MSFHSKDIPLNRIKFDRQSLGDSTGSSRAIHYVSAVAIRLGQRYRQPPAGLAQAIADDFQQFQAANSADPCEQILQKFTISVAPPGWLQFQLSEAGIAEWLQQLIQASHPHSVAARSDSAELDRQARTVFQLWVAHARCCTHLKRAAEASLNLHSPDWLDSAGNLRLSRSSEWQLLLTISDTLDLLTEPPVSLKQTLKIATCLGEALQTFDADCRIWGDTLQHDQLLAEARLGLVQITQFLLRLLLEQLGLPAPREL